VIKLKHPVEAKHFEHLSVKTVDEAISLLDKYKAEAMIIAGGTDLVRLMKNRVIEPRVLVNIKTIRDRAYIKEDAGGLRIGALTTIHDIETSSIVRDKYRMLAEAAHLIAAPQIRNMGTISGNLCQDVQCWYYRRSPVTGRAFFCYRKGGKLCYASTGENAYHAIVGGKTCFAVCPSDMAPPLVALGAKIKILSAGEERIVPLEEFYTPLRKRNILQPNEIITEVQVPAPRPAAQQRFLKFRLRKTIDFAISSVAAVITIEGGVVSNARIVLGGVAPIPYRAVSAEKALIGKGLAESVVEAAAKAAVGEAKPLSMNAYKVPITESLVKRAIAG
jgi:xanthine dehydrogenase YagS FAD-binding subunit